eukprot:741004-Pyramimonas_sp.AAC.1
MKTGTSRLELRLSLGIDSQAIGVGSGTMLMRLIRPSPSERLDKHNGKTGFHAKRFIHGPCRVGTSWFKAQLHRAACDAPPPREHGYQRGRNREGALLCQEGLPGRLSRLDISTLTTKEDMSNAFGPSTLAALRQTATAAVRPDEQEYFHQRHELNTFCACVRVC